MNALLQLSADLDQAIHFRRLDDDESHMGRNIGIGIGAAGIGAGGYYGHKAIMRNYGGNNPVGPMPNLNPVGPMPNLNPSGPMPNLNPVGPMPNLNPVGPSPGLTGPKNAYRSFYEDMKSRGGKYASGVGSAVGEVPGSYNSLRAGAAQGLGYGRGASIKNALMRAGKKIGKLKFHSRIPMVQLSAELDQVISFDDRPEPGFWSKQAATSRAMRRADSGFGKYIASDELIGARTTQPMKYGLGAGAVGAGLGAATGALLDPTRGGRAKFGRKGTAAIGAAVGGLGGMLGGSSYGSYRADKDYLAKRGIYIGVTGLSPSFSKEAARKYLHRDYAGGGYASKE